MKPLVIAHRGASGYAPENTLGAFDLALSLGANGIETDVRVTRDGVPVLMHDARVDRTTDGRGWLGRMTWAQLEVLDAGVWFGPGWRGQRVPRLEEFLERYAGQLVLCLEIKAARAVEPAARLIVAQRRHSDLVITSFSWAVCGQVRRLLPDLAVGKLSHRLPGRDVERAWRAGLRQVWPRAGSIRPSLVAATHTRGLQVMTWDVVNPELLERVVAAGVDGVALDCPDWAVPKREG